MAFDKILERAIRIRRGYCKGIWRCAVLATAIEVIEMTPMIDEYRENATLHGRFTRAGESDKANTAHDRLMSLLHELVAANEDAKLLSLYTDDDPWVQLWAATHTLEV